MFCSNFSFTIFLQMFFPLFSKVFTDILKIYELPIFFVASDVDPILYSTTGICTGD